MKDDPTIIAARADVARRRTQVMATAHELQERLSPKTLARDAWQGAKDKGADLAEDAVDAVRARPVAASGIAAAIAVFLARKPLIGAAEKIADKRKARKSRKANSTLTEKAQ